MRRSAHTLALALAALLLAAPAAAVVTGGAREITFRTIDGWTIHGDYTAVAGATRAVVLLHQRGGSAVDWGPLVDRLAAAGIAALAIDQRGAGRSLGPQSGVNAPWDTSNDIAGAVSWLERRGLAADRVGLAGASYGANNALIYAAAHRETPVVALLSPGRDYNGLKVAPAAGRYRGAVLVLSAAGDPVTEDGPELIARAHRGRALERVSYAGSAHGTRLLQVYPRSAGVLAAFFRRTLAGGR